MKPSTRNTFIALAMALAIILLFITRCHRTTPQATAPVKVQPIPSVASPTATPTVKPTVKPTAKPTIRPTVKPVSVVVHPQVALKLQEPLIQATPKLVLSTPKPTPKPKYTPTAVKAPTPALTKAPVAVHPTPMAPIVSHSAASTPFPAPIVKLPKFLLKLGYWAANNEMGTGFLTNNGMITANLEWKPLEKHDLGLGLSLNAMQSPSNYSSFIWDWYARYGILKAGYRSDDILRSTIPTGSGSKQDLHSEAIFAGLAFEKNLLGDWLSLDCNMLGGNTFHNVAVGFNERILTDIGASLNCRLPVKGWEASVGYRSYVFGTVDDFANMLKLNNTRSASFGSYQGPTLGLRYRF